MVQTKLTLECPYCYWIFEANPPDMIHSAFSFDKPLKGSFYGKVIKQNHVCQNPKCRKSFTIYWYSPLNYFDRI